MLGHLDLEFLQRFTDVTVGTADSSNPSHIISVRITEFCTLGQSLKSNE